jgi:PPM family protein phosphatase
VLIVAEHFERTDTGRQRRANEDAKFARSPLFAVADGMGGAQAGEVASGVAIAALEPGLPEGPGSVEERLAGLVADANEQIHELSRSDDDHAGMGTTLTAAYVGERDVAIAHVGDSRLYCLRGERFERLTRDHSLVEELVQEGKLTPEEADEHPQRNIITRVLGPERQVLVDHMSWRAQPGDVYLICSDGLTSMVPEARVADILRAASGLRAAGQALVDAANDAGGRDNITVVLFRLEEVATGPGAADHDASQVTAVGAAVPYAEQLDAAAAAGGAREAPGRRPAASTVARRLPRAPSARRSGPPRPRRRRLRRVLRGTVIALVIGLPIAFGAFIATRSVFFVGVDHQGFVTLYRGLPYDGPLGIRLYGATYTSGQPAAALPPAVRRTVAEHELRSQKDASDLVSQIEQGRLAGQGT